MVDKLLAEAGSDRARILMAQIYLADMADFDGMNAGGTAGSPRPCAAARHRAGTAGKPAWKIEIVVTAAI